MRDGGDAWQYVFTGGIGENDGEARAASHSLTYGRVTLQAMRTQSDDNGHGEEWGTPAIGKDEELLT